MSTPTCRTCDTKFPGRDVCKACGADPMAEPTIDQKIERTLAKAGAPKETKKVFTGRVEVSGLKFVDTHQISAHGIAKLFDVPASLIAGRERLKYERSVRRSRVRSLQNTKTSGRRYKHGRVGVR